MFKIGIIGTENSHAAAFIDIFRADPAYADMQVVCVGGMYEDANRQLQEKYGVEIVNDAEEMAKMVDAAMITCRDGKYHARYAEAFIKAGISVFIDKPFTISTEEGEALVRLAEEKGVPITGGSSLKSAWDIRLLANEVNRNKKAVKAGTLMAPVSMINEYGGFYFYSSHLAEMCLRVFGYDPIAVTARRCNNQVVAMVEYEDYTVTLHYLQDCYSYYGQIVNDRGSYARELDISFIYTHECEEFADMLRHGKMAYSYAQLLKPVYFINAIYQSFTEGRRVEIGGEKL